MWCAAAFSVLIDRPECTIPTRESPLRMERYRHGLQEGSRQEGEEGTGCTPASLRQGELEPATCKKEKFGGWVSENFLGFCRILDWFYVLLIRLPEETVYKDPVTEPSAWYKKENEAWLGARGFPNKGTAAELRIQVSKLLARDPVREIITKHICSYRHILEMLHTLKTIISTCMKLKVEEHDIINLEAFTRKFLILYDRMDKSMKAAKNGKPGWITQYNFMSLLNIPNVMRNYGSMRNLWEGGEEGEGILRSVKPEIKIGMRGNWQEWLMSNLLKIKSYETVIAREETIPQLPEGEAATSQETQDPVDFKIYGTPEKAEAVINTGRPFSGLRLEVEKAYINTMYLIVNKKRFMERKLNFQQITL